VDRELNKQAAIRCFRVQVRTCGALCLQLLGGLAELAAQATQLTAQAGVLRARHLVAGHLHVQGR
jgi:hypothetical protein